MKIMVVTETGSRYEIVKNNGDYYIIGLNFEGIIENFNEEIRIGNRINIHFYKLNRYLQKSNERLHMCSTKIVDIIVSF